MESTYIGRQYSSGHGDQQLFQPGQNPNYDDQRNRQEGNEIKYPPGFDPSMGYGSQDYPSDDNYPPQGAGSQHFPGQKPINSHADPNATHSHNDNMPRAKVLCKYPGCSFYAIPKFENYCQDCYETNRCQTPNCPNLFASSTTKLCVSCSANKESREQYNDNMPRAKVLCKYPGCSFYAIPEFENYCRDCYETNRCQTPNCPNLFASSTTKLCVSCSANKESREQYNDNMPRAKVLCKYPGCSFYAIPGFESYCQDCYETKLGLENYQRCRTPNCPNFFVASSTTKLCDSCSGNKESREQYNQQQEPRSFQ